MTKHTKGGDVRLKSKVGTGSRLSAFLYKKGTLSCGALSLLDLNICMSTRE